MIPVTAHKAWAAALASFVLPILTYVSAWLLSSAAWSWRLFAAAVVGSALTSLGAGGLTWAVPNQPKHLAEHTAAGVAADVHSANMAG